MKDLTLYYENLSSYTSCLQTASQGRNTTRRWMKHVWAGLLLACMGFVACGKEAEHKAPTPQEATSTAADTATSTSPTTASKGAAAGKAGTNADASTGAMEGQTMEALLLTFEQEEGEARLQAAREIAERLYHAEIEDQPMEVSERMPTEVLQLRIWHGVSELYWNQQAYKTSLHYAQQALPLAYRVGDKEQQSDCEHLVGQNYFRLSDYAHAVEYVRRCLAIDREMGDKSRISSSLNTLAAICLTAKQLKEAEGYVLEALEHSTEARDSNRMAIQYGMASEVYHAMQQEHQALDYARRAYDMDLQRGMTARVGIRLSQMAGAQMALGQYAEAETSVRRAIALLEATGNGRSLSICRNQMGELLNRKGQHTEAARCFEQAVDVFVTQNDLYNESRARIGLYHALKPTQPDKAGEHLLRYTVLKDSIYHRDMEQAVSQQNVRYRTEQLVQKQEEEQYERRILTLTSITLIAVLLMVVLGLLYISRVRHFKHLTLKRVAGMREQFFTNITHELRTPLTLILGLSQDLQASEAPCVREKAQSIERQGTGLLTLINQLLDISKISSSVGKPDWCNGNITAHLSMIVESYRDYAERLRINLQLVCKEAIYMDFVPHYVNKVMNNLLSNALKFTSAHGKVQVAVWREGNWLCIEVTDTGRGMSAETLAHVFEPFYQGGNESPHIGTGVGMALVKRIVDVVKGKITVESEEGKGTTFHLGIPIQNHSKCLVEAAQQTNQPMLPAEEPVLTDSEGEEGQCRLLVIEDNRDIASYIGEQLGDCYAVAYAHDGKEGLAKAIDMVPDLIITDLMMPEMDGLELCRRVRAHEVINHIPLIVVTAKVTEEERLKGLEAGTDAYLTKPFNAEELRTRVDKLLEVRRLLQKKFMQAMVNPKESVPQVSHRTEEADLRFLNKVTEVVDSLLSRNESIDVGIIASTMCMSQSQLYRKVNALTGYSTSAYVLRLKVKRATSLLDSHPQIPINEVCDRSGFSDYSNFLRGFKNVMGISPSDYRRTHK